MFIKSLFLVVLCFVNVWKELVKNIWYVFCILYVLEIKGKVLLFSMIGLELVCFIMRNWNYGKLFCKVLYVEDVFFILGLFSKFVVWEWN